MIIMSKRVMKISLRSREDTPATAVSGGSAAAARLTSSDCSTPLVGHLVKGKTIVNLSSDGLVTVIGNPPMENFVMRDAAISRKDSGLQNHRRS